ncbi:MAG: chromosome segregation protein SMC [Acidimicrobiaceae bacterium]|nr:chromosome segregation protein SMC [Acidimicrobiaceae bacterium]
MFLKRLTMKGFKSFADNTVLEFEPGVTAVVGPNGSGKSNVVDAVTWVLGAQSTRALRSARMDDVIFMGTANRAALGRAEVALTLDNTSGRLPIDGAEVTISRTLFRNGDSEYAINGTTCRLLDVQELLSDSGVGRQQHMIIGQGQLDSILNSSSENRRAVIEEAAGVLKHRRRKERAERRLSSTQENLERLGDLVREVRRQMRPLERQAASARSFSDVEAELRDARHALFAERLHVFESRRSELESELRGSSGKERELRLELVALDAQASAATADMASRREELLASTLGTLQGLAERARGTASLIVERERSLRQALIASADENVIATLEADAAKLAADLAGIDAEETELVSWRERLASAQDELEVAESQFDATWGTMSIESDEAALLAARQRIALLERSLGSLRESERRSTDRIAHHRRRLDEATSDHEKVKAALADAEALERRAADELAAAESDAATAEAERSAADEALRESTDVAARTQARAEALARALDEFSGAGGRAIIGGLDGVLGAFLDLIEIDPGWERAVESAAGASVGAMIVDGRRSARAALVALRREGGAGLILPAADGDVRTLPVPQGATALRTLVRARTGAPDHVTRVLDALFSRAFVATDWESGIDLAAANPELVIVTSEGDRFAASGWRVASGRALVTRSTVEEAQRVALEAQGAVAPVRARREIADSSAISARRRLNQASSKLAQVRAEIEGLIGDQRRLEILLDDLATGVDALDGEFEELTRQIVTIDAELLDWRERLPTLEEALSTAGERRRQSDEAHAALGDLREQVSALATSLARREAAFAERRRLISQRQGEIELRLEGRSSERAEAAGRRESLEFDLEVLERLARLVARAADEIRVSQETMDSTYREQLEASRASAELLEEIRRSRHDADTRLGELSEVVRRREIEHAELVVKIANLHEVILRDLGWAPHEMLGAPHIDLAEGVTLEQRVGELEARITSLGPINPLALDELAALEDRYRELDAQVSDVRTARRELQEVIRALDEEIMATFSSAVADVNEHFSTLIAMLFPGGQGRLILTEPDDPLNTGVEIEVRPMGRNIRRISLLSGGERSMAALAFLFAVFRSRPSPFYMMDEVEAALDDVNLQRFLSLVDEFRDEAQLLIVTHQKRTMEAADALYGVTMVPGASSKVVSQRVKRPSPIEIT